MGEECQRAGKAYAYGGHVILEGPDAIAVTMSPVAAVETAKALMSVSAAALMQERLVTLSDEDVSREWGKAEAEPSSPWRDALLGEIGRRGLNR